eukprot:CAMPEP_0198558128 /NCGR_PEP_ID=MMETSP1462-20131121/89962_1 /TAXON_ID=1333877 /ORGANISM="Brandtodinium nutriculum, Strain RCC3387" /LENGTH=252 /DNA_ID=CAMNT_0044288939 /DNA_START=74 /DNA_END=829 /DNA_ORIENTATION=-
MANSMAALVRMKAPTNSTLGRVHVMSSFPFCFKTKNGEPIRTVQLSKLRAVAARLGRPAAVYPRLRAKRPHCRDDCQGVRRHRYKQRVPVLHAVAAHAADADPARKDPDQLGPHAQRGREEDADAYVPHRGPGAVRLGLCGDALAELHGGRRKNGQDAQHKRDAEEMVRDAVVKRQVHSGAEFRTEERQAWQHLPQHPPVRNHRALPREAPHGCRFQGRADLGIEIVEAAVKQLLNAVAYTSPVRLEGDRSA